MKTVTNTGRRRLGLPGRQAIILDPGQTVEISDAEFASVMQNKTAKRWVTSGVVAIDLKAIDIEKPEPKPELKIPEGDPPEGLPAGVSGKGVELHHRGGGWFDVYVNGFAVTDKSVRKSDAEAIAADY